MHVLIAVEEEFQPDHGQEGTPEPGDADMRAADQPLVLQRIVERQPRGVDGADARGNGDDRQREHDPHPEHRESDTPGEEALLPDLVHFLEHRGVHHRVVEAQ